MFGVILLLIFTNPPDPFFPALRLLLLLGRHACFPLLVPAFLLGSFLFPVLLRVIADHEEPGNIASTIFLLSDTHQILQCVISPNASQVVPDSCAEVGAEFAALEIPPADDLPWR